MSPPSMSPPSQSPNPRWPGPLSDLLVVDLSRVLAGPFCAMILADLGARVIKIERPPTGDDSRGFGPFVDGQSLYFHFINRGKESLALDLKQPVDRDVLLALVRRADVLVENFRPGTMEELGLGYTELARVNGRLIFASISGFGQTGPLAEKPAYDSVIQALSGLMCLTGAPDGPPTRVGTSISDLAAGLWTFGAIASALYHRQRTGRGSRIDVSMLDGTFALLEHALMEYVTTGEAPRRTGNAHPSIAPFDMFQTADRPIVICAGTNDLFTRLVAALDEAQLALDPRFRTNEDRVLNQPALKQALEAALASAPAEHWLEVIDGAGVPCAPIQTVAEAAAHPQLATRNMMIDGSGIRMPGTPLKFAEFPDPTTRPRGPALDAHGAAIRRELGLPPGQPGA